MTAPILDNHVTRAQRFLAMQRERSLFFSNDGIFGDPAWELLLEIYIATEKQECISREELFAELSTTPAIASRWISVFFDRQYVTDCEGQGADNIRMTDNARQACVAYLDSVMNL